MLNHPNGVIAKSLNTRKNFRISKRLNSLDG